jgi:two-component system nitrogen regulation sensor histidine kinase NtrY
MTTSDPKPARARSLLARLTLLACASVVIAVVVALELREWVDDPWVAGALTLAACLPLALVLVRHPLSQMASMFRALAGTVTSYRDGDFSFSLAWKRHDELGELVDAHIELPRAMPRAASSTATWRRASCSPKAGGSRA